MHMKINAWIALGLIVVGVTTPGAAAQQAGPPPPGITRTELENNATVLIARLRMAPGAREDVHTHPFSAVVVQIGAGDVDMRLGDGHTTTRRAHGFVEFIAKEVPHAAANVGQEPFEVVTIAMKPDRRPGGDAPALPVPSGITRAPLLDNADTRVTQVTFASMAREPVHTHPFDLVVVQLTPGRVELRVGEQVSTRDQAPGDVIFLPRDVPHAVSSADSGPFEILSVGIR
jgi:quercetin dioxygenase-like cupin family protein